MKTTAVIPKPIALLFFSFFSVIGFSQQWNWVSGDSTLYEFGDYTNYWSGEGLAQPGSRWGPATWTDKAGNLWLFGGLGFDVNDEVGFLGDLWKFEVSTNRWKLVGGNTTGNQYSVYGVKGTASPQAHPGCRYHALTWTDHTGNFWLYGGTESLQGTMFGTDKADLWKFDPLTHLWTFVNGRTGYMYDPPDLNLCYGTVGVEAATNEPLHRSAINNPTWVDQQGNLWFYSTSQLWRYNVSTDRWTWMGGGNIVDNTFVPQERHFGEKGVPDPDNHPGNRIYPTTFTDLNGDLWLYGGHYSGPQGANLEGWGFLNDLWKYSIANNTWTWLHGDSIVDPPAVFGTQGQSSETGTPGARGAAAGWVGADGTFWLFGGRLWLKENGETYGLYRNDLWKYDLSSNQWTWVRESPQFGDFGLYQDQLNPNNQKRPGARYEPSTWTNSQGLWLFGGSTGDWDLGSRNDLWCLGCDSLKVTMVEPGFEMANVFTPDGDGINDEFRPVRADGYTIRDFSIINRWGEVVFRAIDSPNPWNGTVLGTPATEGVYFWKLEVESYTGEVTNESGFVTLIRH